MIKFRPAPSLGGWLAIINCTAWVILFAALNYFHSGLPEWLYVPFGIAVFTLSLPIAFPFLLPSLDHYHGPTYEGQVMLVILIGVNSFLWGYGIEYALRWTGYLAKPRQPRATDGG